MEKTIKIGKFTIGKNYPPLIIAEAGVNHNGSLKLAKKLVDVAVEAGADAIKFQTFKAENLVTKDTPKVSYQEKAIGGTESQLQMLKKLELNYDSFNLLKNYCDEKNIIFLSTPHTGDVIDFLEPLVPAYKIGSGDLNNVPFLKKIAKKGKPMILGTGMATMDEVKEALNAIYGKGSNEVIMLHCTTTYPCPKNEVNLRAMQTMQNELDCLVGYSDHTLGIDVSLMAVKLDAVVIEKHLTLDKNMKGPDHKASLNPDEFKEMVKSIKRKNKVKIPKEVLGDGIKRPTKAEKAILKLVRKSIISAKDIPPKTKITRDMLVIKRPGIGIRPKELKNLIGKTAKNLIKKDTLIRFSDFERIPKIFVASFNRASDGAITKLVKKMNENQMYSNNYSLADYILAVGDRIETFDFVLKRFRENKRIIHLWAGEISQGTRDEIYRHAMTIMSEIQLCTNPKAKRRVIDLCKAIGKKPNAYVVGNLMLDNLEIGKTKVPKESYDLVLYNPPTILSKKEILKELEQIKRLLSKRKYIWLEPNGDSGSELIKPYITHNNLPRPKFLGLLKDCKRYITNSSSMYYEAPFFQHPQHLSQMFQIQIQQI